VEAKTASIEDSMVVGDRMDNQIELSGAAAGAAPTFKVGGTDTNIGLTLQTKGSGVITVNNAIRAATLDTENNIIELRATDGNYCEISTAASVTDPQVAIHLTSKGGAPIRCSHRIAAYYSNLAAYPEVTVDSGVPALISSGSNTDIDLKFMPKGLGVTRTSWGYYEGEGTSTQALTAAGGLEKLAVNTTAIVNSFPTGAFGIEGTGTRFRNTSGRTAQYIVSYTIGTPNAFTAVLDVHIRKYTSSDVFSGRYAQNRLTGVGTDGPVGCGQVVLRLANNEYFEIVADTSVDTTVGNNSADAHSRFRVTVHQIA
jgi:hypothetical protein